MKSEKLNEELVVYAFRTADGEEEEFVTLDRGVALRRMETNNVDVIERVYEYKCTRMSRRGKIR